MGERQGVDEFLVGLDGDGPACERIWQHALHEENVFNDRLNFFLLAEAMLLVFYATTMGDVSIPTLEVIAALGILLTAFWILINVRQASDLRQAVARMKQCLPDYAHYIDASKSRERLRGSALPVLCYWVPLVVGAIWLALLVELLV